MGARQPTRQLTLFDSVCIIAGIVIGAGIYETTPAVAGNVGSAGDLMAVWILGGLISLAGALCYVELATAFPHEGGDYVYLTKAFGRGTGFVFAWTEYWIVRPGNVGMMAFVFARFAHQLLAGTALSTGNTDVDFVIYAASPVVVMTALNLLGVRSGKTTQNILTTIKIVGLLAVVTVGFAAPAAAPTTATPLAATPDFRLALVFVLFTYGGWNDISYVAAEVRRPEKNILRSLVLGVALITGVYLLVNFAFLHALGLEGASRNNAGNLLELQWGEFGRRAIGVLVCLSCLGAINGTLLAGSRIYYAVGTEHRPFGWLGKWSGRFDAPVRALLVQGATAGLWVVVFGGARGFDRLLAFTAPVFWTFATLVALSVFVLRRLEPHASRPHKVVLYPLTPIIFCLGSLLMLYSGISYAAFNWRQQWQASGWSPEATCTLVVLLAGMAVSWFERRAKKKG